MRAEHISVLFTSVSSVPYMVPNKHSADSQPIFNLCINGQINELVNESKTGSLLSKYGVEKTGLGSNPSCTNYSSYDLQHVTCLF